MSSQDSRDQIFNDVILQDPDICSNCFRRTHDRYERNYRLETVQVEDDDGKMEWTVQPINVSAVEITLPDGTTEEIGGMDDDVYKLPENVTKIPETGARRGLRTVCKCGFRWGPQEVTDQWKNRPLDKKTFFEYADRLFDRLHEAEVSLNEDEFFDKLDELKSNPDEQFADDHIFSKAVEHASMIETVRSE